LTPDPTRRRWPLAALTVAVVAAGFLYQIDGYPLLDPDEGRNAEVAREMAASNDYVLPRLNGLPYVDKPALFFAVGAAFMEILGPTVLAARLAPLLFTLLALGAVALFARRLWGAGNAWIAVVATATTPFVLAYSRTVIFDSAVMLWVTLSLLGFYRAVEDGRDDSEGAARADRGADGRAGDWYRALAWGAIGLGVLTKGPVALALPLMIAVPYALWRRAARALGDPVSLLLFVAIVLPWVVAMSRDVPGFLEYALVTETARRLATPELGRTGPVWYFLAILPAAALPWTAVILAGLIAARGGKATAVDRRTVFLGLWILVPLAFFTLSQSKRPQYVLPLMPAVGLAVAGLWRNAAGRLRGVRAAAVVLAALGSGFLLLRHTIANALPHAAGAVAAQIPATAIGLGAVCLAAAALAWVGAGRRWGALLALSLPVASIPVVSHGLMREVGEDRSAHALAAAIERAAGPETEIVGVGALPLSLPFYLQRHVTVSTGDGAELTSNYVVRNLEALRRLPTTTLRGPDWWRDALVSCTRARVFVVRVDNDEARRALERDLPLLARTRKYAAYGPCGGSLLARSTRLRYDPATSG